MFALDFNPNTGGGAEPSGPCELKSHPSLHRVLTRAKASIKENTLV